MIFYQKFFKHLESKVFLVNPYDPCVVNKTIHCKIFTIVWNIHDLKLSHGDPKVVSEMIVCLKDLYKKLPNSEVNLIEEQSLTKSNKVLNDPSMVLIFMQRSRLAFL